MTIDKFARHISKRSNKNDVDINDIVQRVEEKIGNNLTLDEKHIEKIVIQNLEKNIENTVAKNIQHDVEIKLENINKKIKETDSRLETIEKQRLSIETLPIDNLKIDIQKNVQDVSNLKRKIDENQKMFENYEKRIKLFENKTYPSSEIKNQLSDEFKLKFQTFAKKLYDRVENEIKNFKHTHDFLENNTKNVERTLQLHIIKHLEDIKEFSSFREKLDVILQQISDLKSVQNQNKDQIEQSKAEIAAISQNNIDFIELKKKYDNIILHMSDLEEKIDDIKKLQTLGIDSTIKDKIDEINKTIEALREFIKNEDEKLRIEIEKINKTMGTQIKEVVFFNSKERIKKFRKELEDLKSIKEKMSKNLFLQISDVSLDERRITTETTHTLDIIIKKLIEELDKIDAGIGELDGLINKTSLSWLNNIIKESLDEIMKEISKINEYLREKDKKLTLDKLKKWNETYKSFYDNYFIKS